MTRYFVLASMVMFAFVAQAMGEDANDDGTVTKPAPVVIYVTHDQVEASIVKDVESLAIDITVSPQRRGEVILDDVKISKLLDKSSSRN